jgi:hypothetical protein
MYAGTSTHYLPLHFIGDDHSWDRMLFYLLFFRQFKIKYYKNAVDKQGYYYRKISYKLRAD